MQSIWVEPQMGRIFADGCSEKSLNRRAHGDHGDHEFLLRSAQRARSLKGAWRAQGTEAE